MPRPRKVTVDPVEKDIDRGTYFLSRPQVSSGERGPTLEGAVHAIASMSREAQPVRDGEKDPKKR